MSDHTLVVGGLYRHYKGNEYRVLGLGHHSETEEKLIIYQGMYDDADFGRNPIWARPYEMWFETVEIDGGKQPRFELIADKNQDAKGGGE